MNIKKAILSGILLWILIFFEVRIFKFGFGLESGMNYYVIHYILVFILAALVGLLYFKGRKGNAREGLAAGITMVITGLVLDAIITVPLWIKTYSFFADPYLWVGILIAVVGVFIVGALKK